MIRVPRSRWFAVLFMLIIPCCTDRTIRDAPARTVELIPRFETAQIESGQQKLMFNDALAVKQFLGRGWNFNPKEERVNFPWPRFGQDENLMHFTWNQIIDRRIRIKLLNLPPDLPPQFLHFSLNDTPVIQLQKSNEYGIYEYFLTASLQRTGVNTIGIKVRHDIFPQVPEQTPFAIHSAILTHGAAIQTSISVAEQIRPAIMLAAPISVTFPIDASKDQFLEFDYGLINVIQKKIQAEYSLGVHVIHAGTDRVIRQYELSISGSDRGKSWTRKRYSIPSVTGGTAKLKFLFQPAESLTKSADYLALSEIHIFPSQQIIHRRTHISGQDILMITVSGLGADSLGCYGNPMGKMPFLDRLTQQGRSYARTLSVTNTDPPAIFSLASGLYPQDHGQYTSDSFLDQPVITLPDLWNSHSYKSLAVVYSDQNDETVFSKLHGLSRIYTVNDRGFSGQQLLEKVTVALETYRSSYSPLGIWIHISVNPEWLRVYNPSFDLTDYGPEDIQIDQLNLPLNDMRRLDHLLSGSKDLRELYSKYDRLLLDIDRCIEQIIRSHRNIRSRRELVWGMTSLHGHYLSSHTNVFSSDSLSDEVLSVPMCLGTVSREEELNSRIVDTITSTRSFSGELLTYAGINDRLNSDRTEENSTIYAEHGERRIVMVRDARWKFIFCFAEPYFRISGENLFNIEDDPGERLNLVAQFPDIHRVLKEKAIRFTQQQPVYPTQRPGLTDEASDVLKSLEYL
jgi:Sulfatase